MSRREERECVQCWSSDSPGDDGFHGCRCEGSCLACHVPASRPPPQTCAVCGKRWSVHSVIACEAPRLADEIAFADSLVDVIDPDGRARKRTKGSGS